MQIGPCPSVSVQELAIEPTISGTRWDRMASDQPYDLALRWMDIRYTRIEFGGSCLDEPKQRVVFRPANNAHRIANPHEKSSWAGETRQPHSA